YAYQDYHIPDESTGLIRSKYVAKHFCDIAKSKGIVDGNLLVHRRIIGGEHPNRDTEITTFGDPTRATFNLRPLWSYMPWLAVAAAVTWFFARRAKIKATTAREDDRTLSPK